MGKVAPLFMIGFGVFVSGFYWHVWDDCISFIEDYIISDTYYELIRFGWDAIPIVILVIGIIWLIRSGTGYNQGVRVQ